MVAPIPADRIEKIVSMYRDETNTTLDAVASSNGVSVATVRKYVERAGVFVREDFVLPVKPAGDESAPANASDEDLGIGEDVVAEVSNPYGPEFHAAVAAAVAAEMAKVKAPAKASKAEDGPESLDWKRFMDKMGELTDSVNVQKPGYQKPLTAEELSSREQGQRKFFAFFPKIRMAIAEHGKEKAIALGLVPEYIVGEKGFYGSTASGEMQFMPGLRLRLTTPPPEDFLPMNDLAGAIMQAQMQWLGEPTPEIGELVAQAMMRAKGVDPTYVAGLDDPVHPDDATIVAGGEPLANIGPKRTMGTSVQELRATNTPFSPGSSPVPSGPIFVN